MKNKTEPASERTKRLLLVLSMFSFSLYERKRYDMVYSLSRIKIGKLTSYDIIIISCDLKKSTKENILYFIILLFYVILYSFHLAYMKGKDMTWFILFLESK